jgi:N-alpha-acetyltransferase 40
MPEALPRVEAINALSLEDFQARCMPFLSPSTRFEHASSGESYMITLTSAGLISAVDLQHCQNLIASTSAADYAASSLGWRPRKKLREMRLPDMRYLLVRKTPEQRPEAFASFMVTYEDGYEVVYVYEIHVSAALRGCGLGRRLMDLVEETGREAGLRKVMLTVFDSNEKARAFYRALGYVVDDFSPGPRELRGGRTAQPDYVILSKDLRR